MSLWHRYIFPVGLLLLAHSVYLALRIREQLQEYHHQTVEDVTSGGYFPMASSATGCTAHMNASTIPVFIELLIGMALSIIGHVKQSSFKPARLIDKNCFESYDNIMNTGVGFMHFNHRAATGGSQMERVANGDGLSLATKKKA